MILLLQNVIVSVGGYQFSSWRFWFYISSTNKGSSFCVLTYESFNDSSPLNLVVLMVSGSIICTESIWK